MLKIKTAESIQRQNKSAMSDPQCNSVYALKFTRNSKTAKQANQEKWKLELTHEKKSCKTKR